MEPGDRVKSKIRGTTDEKDPERTSQTQGPKIYQKNRSSVAKSPNSMYLALYYTTPTLLPNPNQTQKPNPNHACYLHNQTNRDRARAIPGRRRDSEKHSLGIFRSSPILIRRAPQHNLLQMERGVCTLVHVVFPLAVGAGIENPTAGESVCGR